MILVSFKLINQLPASSYLLIRMDWYLSAIIPYQCILINTSISVQCTNFASPTTFQPLITQAQLKLQNPLLDSVAATKTVIIQVLSLLSANT
jgi:hypothetical protein